MAQTPREKFERERERCQNIEDDDVAVALGYQFADALDPEDDYVKVPIVEGSRLEGHESKSNSTARNYLSALRCAHERGLDLLGADAKTVNHFIKDLVNDPDDRRYGLVDYDGSIGKPSAKSWQSALRAFYRFCAEPGVSDERPDTTVPWEDVNGSRRIHMFTERSEPKHKTEGAPRQDDLEALREACLEGQNTRRDRAFLELAAGTGQRVRALVTLRVGDVYLDGTDDDQYPHVMLNPEIKNDGDKGAIENAGGRLRPMLADTGPVRQWIEHHPLQDPDVRAEHGVDKDFEDCYLFVGSLKQRSTDASGHWGVEAARNMLSRRKSDTEALTGTKTVEVPVNPHAWRHYAYTKSKSLDLDESDRRRMFGWAPGSDTGEKLYDDTELSEASGRISEKFAEAFGDEESTSVAEQVVGDAIAGDLSPEARTALVSELISNEDAMRKLGEAAIDAAAE